MLNRPLPPEDLAGFRPAPDVEAWARATFIDDAAALLNEEHRHLVGARIGFLWTDVANGNGPHVVVGQAEIPSVQGGKWARARFFQQLEEWFGEVPDFLITLHAESAREADDATWCAVVEHELYHCGQAVDAFGAPKFRKDGSPAFSIRKHDVEEFVGVVARYGAGSAAGQTRALVEAANAPPLIAASQIAGCCGTCGRGV